MNEPVDIRVLHVDDEPDFVELAADMLEREDDRFTVTTATSASEGSDRLAEATDEFDCVVSDYQMPGQNGIEFFETVREDYPDLPFILFTGKGSEDVASDAISAGITDYLQKGSGTEQYTVLATRIRNAVEKRQSERARQRQLEAIETAHEGISILDEDGQFLYVNEAYADLYGYDPDEMVGEHWELIYPGEEVETARETILPEVEETGFWHGTTTGLRADGSTFREDHRIATTDHGELVCTVRDLTERQERERELERARQIIQRSTDIATVIAPDGTIKYVSPTVERVLGYKPEELIGNSGFEYQPPETSEAVADAIEHVLENPDETRTVQTRFRRADGSWCWIESTLRNKVDEDMIDGILVSSREITKRKEREQKLERTKTFLEQSPVAVAVVDESGEITYQSPTSEHVTGLSADELIGDVAFEYVHPDDRADIVELFSELIEDPDESRTAEYRLEDGDGNWQWIQSTAINYLDEPAIDGIVIASFDITERKEYEQELNTRATAMETAIDGMSLLNDDGEYVYVNEAHADVYGYDSTEAFLDETWRMCYDDEEIERFEEDIIPVLSEEGSWRGEVTGRRKDGSTFPQEVSLTATDDGGIICVVRDITGRKEHEDTLEELHEATRDLMTATTAEEVATRASETATQVLKVPINGIHRYDAEVDALVPVAWADKTEDQLDGSPPALPVDDSLAGRTYRTGEAQSFADVREADETFDPETPFRNECILPLGDYGVFILSSPNVDTFDAADEALAQVFAANVEAALDHVEQRQQLQRERDRLDEFASIISHDLRNPLNVATARLELAQAECDSDHLDDVAQAHDRMDALIDDVLTLAREGEQVEEPEAVDLANTSDGCWRNVETDGATLVTETEQTIHADPSRLKRLLENLFRNAVEHGGETVTITVGDLVDERGFYVADDGPGIPEDEREAVFEAGYSTAETGTGFGLSIVQGLAEAHGWDIAVADGETGGARFDITGVETIGE